MTDESDWQPPSEFGWCTYQLITKVGDVEAGRFVLRQCPRCSALVQVGNEDHHEAWHLNLDEAIRSSNS